MLIPPSLLTSIRSHAREAYPAECCGMLIGTRTPEFIVTRIHPAANRATAPDRYDIDPLEVHAADTTTWGTDEEIIGFYHSHPDHTPEPSAHDTALAWVSYCYLIVGVNGAGETETRAWVRGDDSWDQEVLAAEEGAVPGSAVQCLDADERG